MNILILTNNDSGLYKFRLELVKKLCEDHTVYISLPQGKYVSELEKAGCLYCETEFNRRGTNPFEDIRLYRKYRMLLQKITPDLVLTYTIKPNVYGGFACSKEKIPYLANVTGLGTAIENGGFMRILSTTMYRIGLRKASCIFFQNSQNERLFEKLGVKGKKHILLPGSGVNLSVHSFEEYPPDGDKIHFLFIGRIMKDKGIQELVDATRTVKQKGHNIITDIVGWFDEDYHDTIEEAEKEEIVHFYGEQTNVHEFIKKSHCVVLPSYHEGMSNVLLEAAATGRPIIASRIPGCMETFEEGVTGIGCERKNADSLADAMLKFLMLPMEERARMGLRGREKMEREFDRNLITDVYIKEIEKAIK